MLAALDERDASSEVLVSALISQNADQAIVEQEVLEIKKLLHGTKALVVTSASGSSQPAQIAEVICDAHLTRHPRTMTRRNRAAGAGSRAVQPAEIGELVHRLAVCGTHQDPAIRFYAAIKDAFEPLVAGLLLLALSPLVLFVALLVKLTSPGPVFYRQTRLGHRRQLFDIIKFRSMRVDAEKDGPRWASASKSDSRLTPIGGFLRATHLDEIPQIWNVVRGELSFVGPRPERPVFCQELEEKIPLFRLRTLVKPGITGWAQIRAGYANSDRRLEAQARVRPLLYPQAYSPGLGPRVSCWIRWPFFFSGGSEGRKRERARLGPRQRIATSVQVGGQGPGELPGLTRAQTGRSSRWICNS